MTLHNSYNTLHTFKNTQPYTSVQYYKKLYKFTTHTQLYTLLHNKTLHSSANTICTTHYTSSHNFIKHIYTHSQNFTRLYITLHNFAKFDNTITKPLQISTTLYTILHISKQLYKPFCKTLQK